MAKKKKKEFKELPLGAEAAESSEYVRTRWKHYLRWLMFSFVMLLYFMLALTSYKTHVLLHHGFELKELLVYVLCSFMMIPIIPSVVLEVDYVKISREDIVFQNLLLRRRERWENIVKFDDHWFLKFVIVRTRGFVYLLNRRDIPQFDQLVETIRDKAIKLKK